VAGLGTKMRGETKGKVEGKKKGTEKEMGKVKLEGREKEKARA